MGIINRDNFRFRLRIFRRHWTVLVGTDGFPSTVLHFWPFMVLGWPLGLHRVRFSLFDRGESGHDLGGPLNPGHAKSGHSKGRHPDQRHANVSFGLVRRH